MHPEEIWEGRAVVEGNLLVPRGKTLRVLPGTRVFFAPLSSELEYRDHPYFPGSELIVQGRLIAEGTESQPIVFMSLTEDDPAGSWGGINIHEAEASFSHARFLSADSAIHAAQSRVVIKNCTFERNLVGVRFNNSILRLLSSRLINNDTAIRFHHGAPVVEGNRLSGNRRNIFISDTPRDYRFAENRFGRPGEYQVALAESITIDVDLSGNYWEDCDAPGFESLFYDQRVASYLGRVQPGPCLVDEEGMKGGEW